MGRFTLFAVVLFSLIFSFVSAFVEADDRNPNEFIAIDGGALEYFPTAGRVEGTTIQFKNRKGTMTFLGNNRVEIRIGGKGSRFGALIGCNRSFGSVSLSPVYVLYEDDHSSPGQPVCKDKMREQKNKP